MTLSEEIRTPEGFIERLHSMSPKVFAKAVTDFNDADRRKLSKVAQDHAKALQKEDRAATSLTGVPLAEMIKRASTRFEHKNVALAVAHLGLLAVAPKSANMVPFPNSVAQSEAWSRTEPTEHEEAAITLLLDRRPDWAQAWMERQLQVGDWGWCLNWLSVKRLLDDGLCTAPDTQQFAQFMHFVVRGSDLTKHAELTEHIWAQFRHSTGFLHHDGKLRTATDPAKLDRWASGAEWIWYNVHHRRIDRDRVIDESLAAYWRDFNNAERSTLGKLLDALELTDDEFVARQEEFRKLLSHETPAVVTFVLKQFKAKKKADGLDVDAVISELPQVFSITTKTQPKSALVLLKSLVGKDRVRLETAAGVAAEALQHEEVDVQEAAIKLLEGWAKKHVPVDALQQVGSHVFPAVRSRVDALLAEAGIDVERDSEPIQSVDTSDMAAELFRQIEACSPVVRKALKLDEALAAATAGEVIPPADIDELPIDLSRLDIVEPLQSVHDLIDEFSRIIGNVESPMQVERVLDGISRFGRDYPDDFDARVAPILKAFEADDDRIPPFQAALLFPATYGLIFDWLRKNLHSTPARLPKFLRWVSVDPPNVAKALDLRAVELRRRFLETREALPLLSLPTHDHGWIEPNVLVERLHSYKVAETKFSAADWRIALLRLPPHPQFDDAQIRSLPDNVQRLLRYVAGAEPDLHPDACPAAWLAAGRSCNPRGPLPVLSKLKIPDKAWGLQPAEIKVWLANSPPAIEHQSWQQQKELERKQKEGGGASLGHRLRSAGANLMAMTGLAQLHAGDGRLVSIEPLGDGSKLEFPTVVMATRSGSFRRWFESQLPDWAEEWQATHWPANTDGSFAMAMAFMLIRMDSNASSWEPSAPALRPLLWSERGWSETAITALWLALFSKDNDVRSVGTDALIEGTLDGRAHPDKLTPPLVDLLQQPWLKLNRLVDALAEVVRVSRWSAFVVSEVLDSVIATWTDVPRDAHHLFTVQLAALMEVDGRLSEDAQQPLKSLKGSSKTAKLAKQLVALTGSPDSETRRAALLEGLQGRLQQAPA